MNGIKVVFLKRQKDQKQPPDNRVCNLFGTFNLTMPKDFHFWLDDPAGTRRLMSESKDKTTTLYFEKGMSLSCIDMNNPQELGFIEPECRRGNTYIHQARIDPEQRNGNSAFCFFHIEIIEHGEIHILPGEMSAKYGYKWSDGVEPMLLDIMSLSLSHGKSGGLD